MKLDKLYIVLFMSFLVLPTALFLAIGTSTKNTENRVTSEFPKFENKTIDEYISSLDSFYSDNIPYKSDIVNFQKKFKIKLFNEIDDPKVIIGKDEWLFYKGDDGISSINDFMGVTKFSDDELNLHVDIFKSLEEECSKRGIKLVVLIGPNKSSIYGNKMPDKYEIIDNLNASRQLADALTNEGIYALYPHEELKQSADYYTYYKYDTHWNDVGSFIVSQLVLDRLCLDSVSLNEVNISEYSRNGGDLANMLAMSNDFVNDKGYLVSYKTEIDYKQINNKETGSPIAYTIYQCDNSINDSNLFYYGDSFATAIKPYLCKNFSKSYFMHRNDIITEFSMPAKGDVIILETVERYTKSLAVDAQNLLNLILSNQ